MWRVAGVVVVCWCACGPNETRPIATTPVAPPATQIGEPSFDPPLPTLRLPRNFTPTKYTARLDVDPAKPDFAGEIAIDGTLDRRSSSIWLSAKQLTVQHAFATNGSEQVPISAIAKGDYLELRPAHALNAGAWQLVLSYRGEIAQTGLDGAYLTTFADERYIATKFEATAARLVFPCFDEPDRKTPWQLTLDVPKGQLAFSNTPTTSVTSLDGSRDRFAFATTRPLPSYLIVFAVGPWDVVDAGKAKSGVPIRIITPHGTAKKVAYLASVEPRIVDFLESWFAVPFPYPKLDILVVPTLDGGAMENAGMIADRATLAMYEHPSATERWLITDVVGHETAHQWFGDLVTAAWWDDIWLNESFATWMEDKVTTAIDPSWPSQVLTRRRVFADDELASARKIRQPIETEGDIHDAFDSITYPKGGLVLRMLEHQIGEAKFQAAIRGYIAAHADGNARAADVFAALDRANGASLAAETASFFDQPGVPEVAMTLACTGTTGKVTLAQARSAPTGALPAETWTMPVCVAYEGAAHDRRESCTVLAAPTAELALDRCPAWIAPSGTYGYYRIKLDAKAIDAIRDHAWPLLSADERIAIAVDVWSAARSGRQPLALALGLFAKLRAGSPREQAAGLGDASVLGFSPATGLPEGLAELVPIELRDAARAKVRGYVEPLARKLGLVAAHDEDFDAEIARKATLGAAAWSHTHVLDAEATRVSAHWRDLPSSSRHTALALAVAADPTISDRLAREALDERDPVSRDLLFKVLGEIADSKRHRAVLDKLVADPKSTPDDVITLLLAGDVEAQRDSERYIRAHWDDLMTKLPAAANSDYPLALFLESAFVSSCDAARRDDIVQFLQSHFASIPSGDRPTKQSIESLDRCIARKQLVEPAIRAWLAK